MGAYVEVRGVRIGEGVPKICVPIVGKTKEEILAAAKSFENVKKDVVEFRVDWFEGVFDFAQVENVLKELREILKNTPILFTFRTSKEGGEKEIEPEVYVELNKRAAATGLIDLVDVEAFTGDAFVKEVIDAAHESGVVVVASNHDFDKTPDKEEIVKRLRKMQELDADIPKIAVMPQNKKDVLTLLSATEEMASEYADQTNYHNVNGRNRTYQPSLRGSVWLSSDIWCSRKSFGTGTDECGGLKQNSYSHS